MQVGMDIVCGVDFGESSRQAARGALAFVSRSGGRVHLVHAMQLPAIAWAGGEVMLFPAPQMDTLPKQGVEALVEFARSVSESTSFVSELDIATPAEAIADAATRTKSGLVCVGTHGRSAPVRWVLGSTAERVIARASVPVLVFRGDADAFVEWGAGKRVLRVLVGDDFGDSFPHAVEQLSRLTGLGGLEIHLAHVSELPLGHPRYDYMPLPPRMDVENALRVEMRRRAEAAGLAPRADSLHVLWGSAAGRLAILAREGRFDLVVTGTHTRRGLDRALLGSVALGTLRRSPVPVLVVPMPHERMMEVA